jgi:hypothetical protein
MPFRLSVPAGDTARVGLGDVVGRGPDAVILDHGDGLVLRRPLETRMMGVHIEPDELARMQKVVDREGLS